MEQKFFLSTERCYYDTLVAENIGGVFGHGDTVG